MYASKRRQRNFKRVRETTKPGAPTNPSKRHRERLNGELETVAGLLPFDDVTLQRLDKLSVLRLAVSYLQIKAHFHVCESQLRAHGKCGSHPLAVSTISAPMGPVPSFVDSITGFPLIDPMEPLFNQTALKALGGFVLILDEHGEIYYVSENIEYYLGFLQSDILHQPIFDMIHSEDREDIRLGLQIASETSTNLLLNGSVKTQLFNDDEFVERTMIARFRCLLDNTCGFIRAEIRGRFTELHATTQMSMTHHHQQQMSRRYGLLAVCTPFVPPIQSDVLNEDPILKTKHALDMTLLSSDVRFKQVVELEDVHSVSFYDLVHPKDVQYVAEAHTSAGLMIYRLVGTTTGFVSYVQTSLRVFFKNSKAESIGGTHRILTEVDGIALLEKRTNMKSKFLTFDDTLLQSPRHHLNSSVTQQAFVLKYSNSKPAFESPSEITTKNVLPPSTITSSSSNISDPKIASESISDVNIKKLQQMLPDSRELLQQPSTSTLSHPQQTFLPAPHLFSAPIFPIQLPDQIPVGSMFSNYFPTHQVPPTDAENLWSQGFKRPLEIYSDPLTTAYYHPSAHFENAPYYIDYNCNPNAWIPSDQQPTLNTTDIQPSTSNYGQRIKLNELGQSNFLLNGSSQQMTVEDHQGRYYPLTTTFFPPNEQQQFSQLDVVPAANNFDFLSEVTQTLLGNHCQ